MPRIARMLRTGEQTVYHVMFRTALDGYPLGDVEKDYLVNLFKQLGRLYFVEIIGYCVMSSHFHLFRRKTVLSDEQIPLFRENFLRFNHLFQTQKDRLPKRVTGLDGMYSLKRLSEE